MVTLFKNRQCCGHIDGLAVSLTGSLEALLPRLLPNYATGVDCARRQLETSEEYSKYAFMQAVEDGLLQPVNIVTGGSVCKGDFVCDACIHSIPIFLLAKFGSGDLGCAD